MTNINIATQIPSQITTLEQLHAWSSMALFAINPTLVVIEGVGYTERACQNGQYWVAADSKTRMICRTSLAVSPNALSANGKSWTFVQELSNTALPSTFSAN